MKKVSFLVIAVSMLALASCGDKNKTVDSSLVNNPATANGQANGELAKIEFAETSYNFGEIIQGQTVEHTFKFKNTGDHDLVIIDAKGSCGCTVPEYPKTPIKPGAEGEIHVKFDSTNKKDHQEKTVKLTANTQPQITTLTITGDVIVK